MPHFQVCFNKAHNGCGTHACAGSWSTYPPTASGFLNGSGQQSNCRGEQCGSEGRSAAKHGCEH
eukprot:1142226-Pelagomonas_calceolata.AAC.2